jgi:hypothetical protein
MANARYFVPTGDGGMRPAEMLEWAEWFEQENATIPFREGGRLVARFEAEGLTVSTVFLGMNHSFGGRDVLVFETMVFGGPHNDYMRRYGTLAEAEAGHAETLQLVQGGN